MNTNRIIFILLQITAISGSMAILYGVQKWINSNSEFDKENVAAIERTRILRRQKYQRMLEMFQTTDPVDVPLLEISNYASMSESFRLQSNTR